MTERYGATPEEWQHLSLILGLTPDLLPVVSNPNATISAGSKMQSIGKTPSRYNGSGHVSGLPNWTQHNATSDEVRAWSKQPDYGVCIQTRTVRALDVDVDDPELADEIANAFGAELPTRTRQNAAKRLLAFTLLGEYTKRSFKTKSGIVEFLATGQQFVACGTHPSGYRYEWLDGMPDEFPTIAPEQFESLWSSLVNKFAIEPEVTSKSPLNKKESLNAALENDPVARFLTDNGWVHAQARDGRLDIRCPFESQHSGASSLSATVYFPAYTGGRPHGGFDCKHTHCQGRTRREFLDGLGYSDLDGFGVVEAAGAMNEGGTKRFQVIPAHQFSQAKAVDSLIYNVIPDADLVVVFGESGSGKTFLTLDMLLSVATGTQWRDRDVTQGACVYVAAEGSTGFRKRLKAVADDRKIDLADVPLGVIADAPDFSKVADIKDVIAAINAFGAVKIVTVDTLAQVINGDENGSKEMGLVIQHCKAIRKHTGAVVLLIHHVGKTADKGARGHSSLRGGSDTMIEVERCDGDRVATIYKHKDLDGEGDEFGFKLNAVIVGQDAAGRAITSCVVEHVAATPKSQRRKPIKGDVQKIVMRVLDSLIGLDGDEDGPDLETLKVACVAQLVAPDEGRVDRRRDEVSRAINTLTAGGHIYQKGGGLNRAEGGDVQ